MSTGRPDPAPRDVPDCADAEVAAPHGVAATNALAVAHAQRHGVAADAHTTRTPRAPHPSAPAVGTRATTTYVVADDDTATAVGHPDPTMLVLSSPTLALWFELASSRLLPAPGGDLRHVGVGIVVHHLDGAVVGDEVVVAAEVAGVDGRSVRFVCDAYEGTRLLASGVHQRLLLDG